MKMKEESEKADLKLNVQKNDHDIQSHHLKEIDAETMKRVTDYFFGLQNHCRW